MNSFRTLNILMSPTAGDRVTLHLIAGLSGVLTLAVQPLDDAGFLTLAALLVTIPAALDLDWAEIEDEILYCAKLELERIGIGCRNAHGELVSKVCRSPRGTAILASSAEWKPYARTWKQRVNPPPAPACKDCSPEMECPGCLRRQTAY